jgi:hypothetical protein
MRSRFHRQSVDGVRQEAGVGDQSNACVHGTEGCPGPNAGVLPCSKCFLGGGRDA